MGERDEKNTDHAALMSLLFAYSLRLGIEYGKELLERNEETKREALELMNDTLKKILTKK